MTGKYQWSFLFSLSDILCELNPAGQNVRQDLSLLLDISRSLPDMSGMSGIFRDHCYICKPMKSPLSIIPYMYIHCLGRGKYLSLKADEHFTNCKRGPEITKLDCLRIWRKRPNDLFSVCGLFLHVFKHLWARIGGKSSDHDFFFSLFGKVSLKFSFSQNFTQFRLCMIRLLTYLLF